jgi:hypothetical protein
MTPSGIELVTYRFVAQCLNHYGYSGMFAIKLCANAPGRELVTVIKLQATENYGTDDTCTKIYFFLLLDSHSGPTPPHCSGFEITLRQDTLHSVGLLRTSDQPDAETST